MVVSIKPGSSFEWSQFGELDCKLVMIFFDLVCFLRRQGVDEVVVTSGLRPKVEDSGVHALFRAMDVSTKNIPADLILPMLEYINTKYPYDTNRPQLETAIWHTGTGYGGDVSKHLHLQVMG